MSLNNSYELKTKLESFMRNNTIISSILYGILFHENIQTSVPTDNFNYTILMSGLMANTSTKFLNEN